MTAKKTYATSEELLCNHIKTLCVDEEIQEIAEEFKDKDARLEAISQNTGNIQEALQNELEKVTQAEETIANTLNNLPVELKRNPIEIIGVLRDNIDKEIAKFVAKGEPH